MKITINKHIEIEANEDSTLLELMESMGLDPEYQCREGHCGSCRCKLASGKVEYTNIALASIEADEILPCICKANSDMELHEVNCDLPETKKVASK